MIVLARLDIVWVDDPDATEYQRPCVGCADFCEIELDELLREAYPEVTECSGVTCVRRTTVWEAQYWVDLKPHDRVVVTSQAQTAEEASSRALAKAVSVAMDNLELPPYEDR